MYKCKCIEESTPSPQVAVHCFAYANAITMKEENLQVCVGVRAGDKHGSELT